MLLFWRNAEHLASHFLCPKLDFDKLFDSKEQDKTFLRNSSPKNESFVINLSSCCSKPALSMQQNRTWTRSKKITKHFYKSAIQAVWTLSTEERGFEWFKCEQMMTEDSFFAQALFMSGTDVLELKPILTTKVFHECNMWNVFNVRMKSHRWRLSCVWFHSCFWTLTSLRFYSGHQIRLNAAFILRFYCWTFPVSDKKRFHVLLTVTHITALTKLWKSISTME